MNDSKISVRYARALFQSAAEQSLLDEVRRDMLEILKISRVDEFNMLLESPVISQSKKLEMIDRLFSGKLEELSVALFRLVIRNGREENLAGIARNFADLYRKHKGIVSATFTTAVSMEDEVKERVEKVMKDVLKTPVELSTDQKEELIGGFVLRIEDRQYDASVSRSLNEVKKQLLKQS